ncbi:hypothetical protein F4779DRAFT_632770 [Xylariaceae sp. FL0662B]|nr:hypothetical protein F4779DRAFT_632770 [Xylariaceae sp. FL0662B]
MSSGKPWTDAEKYSFLVQAVDQFIANGGKLDYGKLKMPGRSPKAMMHILEKTRDSAAEFRNGAGDTPNAPATPVKAGQKSEAGTPTTSASLPRKRTKKADASDDDKGIVVPLKKVRRTAPTKVKQEVKVADSDTEEKDVDDKRDVFRTAHRGAGVADGEI